MTELQLEHLPLFSVLNSTLSLSFFLINFHVVKLCGLSSLTLLLSKHQSIHVVSLFVGRENDFIFLNLHVRPRSREKPLRKNYGKSWRITVERMVFSQFLVGQNSNWFSANCLLGHCVRGELMRKTERTVRYTNGGWASEADAVRMLGGNELTEAPSAKVSLQLRLILIDDNLRSFFVPVNVLSPEKTTAERKPPLEKIWAKLVT